MSLPACIPLFVIDLANSTQGGGHLISWRAARRGQLRLDFNACDFLLLTFTHLLALLLL